MKRFLIALLLLSALVSQGQVETVLNNIPWQGHTIGGLIYSPGHATGNKYPLFCFFHGSGESGTNPAQIYNSTTAGGPCYLIEHGAWPVGFANWKTGTIDTFIVFSPQTNNSWSTAGDDVDGYITYLQAQGYPIDTNRIILSGLSAGGGGDFENAAHLDGNEDIPTGANDHVRRWKAAALIPMSAATNNPSATWSQKIVTDSIRVWGTGDPNNDTYGEFTQTNVNNINAIKAGYAFFTSTNYGHGGWANLYITTFRATIDGHSQSIYEWATTQVRTSGSSGITASSPTCSAGTNHTVIYPASNSVTLTATASPGNTHTTASTAWSYISGPAGSSIGTPGSLSTNVTSLVVGTYDFRFTINNEAAQTCTSDVSVSVINNSYGSPSITVSSNPTIVSPASSVSLTSTPAFNGASQSTMAWSKLQIPGQALLRIGVLGSSYPQGSGATVDDSAFMGGWDGTTMKHGLFKDLYTGLNIIDTVFNLSQSGFNVYQVMPTGNTVISDVNAKLSPSDSPRTAYNITALLKHNINVCMIFFPTNGYDVLTIAEIVQPFQVLYDTCTNRGIQCYIGSPAPRTDQTFSLAKQQFLQVIRDTLMNRFGSHCIDIYDALNVPGTTQMLPNYMYFDSIHPNNAGHKVIFNTIEGTNVFKNLVTAGPTLTTQTSANTAVTGLATGTTRVQATVFDTHHQAATGIVTITVSPGGTASANAGSPQSITLPVSMVTLSGASSIGATTYAWTRISGPNVPGISGASTVTATLTGLIQGVYIYQLSINSGASTAQVAITVNPVPPVGACQGAVYFITPDPVDSSVYITHTNSNYQPGDSLVFASNAYSSIDIEGLRGRSGCPIVIINRTVVPLVTKRINLDGCQYVKLTGSGSNNQYGFLIQQDPQLRTQSYNAIQINDLSKDIEVERISMHNVDIGIVCETNEDCNTALDYPNWSLDSMSFHDNKIVGTWNEGMYIGNTSPDNASYDLRPVVCNGVTFYYAPMKNGYCKVYNNIVDSTGRGGIQLANAASGVSEIYGNTIKHTGMNGDDAQGSAITIGLYSRAYIHDNNISNTFTWGIAVIGGGATNVPLRIENNTIDSSGYLVTYNLAQTNRIVYDPRTEPTFNNLLTWAPQSIEVDTRPRLYTDQTPQPGTAVRGQDSTQFWIKGNVIKLKKNSVAINIDDDYAGIQKVGNIICGNTAAGIGAVVNSAAGVVFSSVCAMTGPINYHPIRRGSKLKIITH